MQCLDCLRITLHLRTLKPGQPKPLGNNAHIDHPGINMKSVTSWGHIQAHLLWVSNPKWPVATTTIKCCYCGAFCGETAAVSPLAISSWAIPIYFVFLRVSQSPACVCNTLWIITLIYLQQNKKLGQLRHMPVYMRSSQCICQWALQCCKIQLTRPTGVIRQCASTGERGESSPMTGNTQPF